MTMWPHPGDSPEARARRVAHAYRAKLDQIAPGECRQLDQMMSRWGQHWVTPRVLSADPDEWLSTADAADLAGVQPDTIGRMRRRGRLTGRQINARKWEYQAAEIFDTFVRKRTRTDNITRNGRSVPKTKPAPPKGNQP